MKRCPRCSSTMVLESASTTDGLMQAWERVWKCVGCGREIPHEPQNTTDERRDQQTRK